MKEMFVIVYSRDEFEETESYENYEEARADYINMINNECNCLYAILQRVTYEDTQEIIEELDEYYR